MTTRKTLMYALIMWGIVAVASFAVPQAKAERYYDETGKYQGRIDDNGRIYDSRGKYKGRIENNRVYDSTGKYRGKRRHSAVVDDHNEWTGASIRSDTYYLMHRGHYRDEYED